MSYISTDESEKYDIKNDLLIESPVRGSTTRFICIVDDIEADPPKGRARRKRVNIRVIIDTAVPDGDGFRYEPPSCLVVGDPSVNDLATHRWQNNGLPDAATEAALIQRTKDGDERTFRQLLEAFHRTVVGPANDYVPRGTFSRRQPKKQKHTNELLYEDLTSVGCFALWQSALKFDPDRSYRFSTLSRHKIIGAISNEASYLRKRGYTSGDTVGRYSHKKVSERSETRLDRWIFDHLGSPPEDLLEAQKKLVKRPVFHSLQEAADALKAANNLEHPDVYSDSGNDEVERDSYSTAIKTNTATEPLEEFRDDYQSQNPLYWSPQLAFHGNPLRGTGKVCRIVDFWIRELCDPRIKAKSQPKPVYPPCTVKPTGRVLHPIDKPYWMEPREKPPNILERKPPYDPDRREVATVRLKNGKTKRQYRQMRAEPDRSHDVAWRAEYRAGDWYSWMTSEREKRNPSVRTEPNKANGSASANVVILESQEAARRDFMSVSNVTRRALASDLRVRGLLADDEGEVIA
jgi:hypothetical protein